MWRFTYDLILFDCLSPSNSLIYTFWQKHNAPKLKNVSEMERGKESPPDSEISLSVGAECICASFILVCSITMED